MMGEKVLETDQLHNTLNRRRHMEYNQADNNARNHQDMGHIQMDSHQNGLRGDYRPGWSFSLYAMEALQ
jgi:hypothetical protein